MRASAHVRFCPLGEEIVLLDLLRGKYLLLDPVAAAMWNALLSGDEEVLVHDLSERFGSPASTIENDLKRFRESCVASGLLQIAQTEDEAPSTAEKPASRPVWLTGQALWALVRTFLMLRSGLLTAYKESQRTANSVRLRPEPEITSSLVENALQAFVRAENVWSFKKAPDDCLPRSLALHRYLRRLGLPVTHHIGISKTPLEMHAWVEFRSRPLLNDLIAAKHTPIASIR